MNESAWTLIGFAVVMVIVIAGLSMISQHYTLNIKSRTVGDGQHGTARWATKQEIQRTYHLVRYDPQAWRRGKDLPKVQGIIAGSVGRNPTPIEFKIRKKNITIHVERLAFQKHKCMKAIAAPSVGPLWAMRDCAGNANLNRSGRLLLLGHRNKSQKSKET